MKNLILLVTFLVSISVFAQKPKKNAKVVIKVDGVCMMCKKRIEKAALNIKGVKYANWNVKSHELKMIVDERKTNKKAIEEKVASVGHDTETVTAPQEAYDNIHPCCKYRDEEIQKSHENGKQKKQ